MAKFSELLGILGMLSIAMMLGILDNTLIDWPEVFGIILIIEVLCLGLLAIKKVKGAFLPSLGLTAILSCFFFWANYRWASTNRKEVKLAVLDRGCNGCERVDPTVHRPFVVVQYEGKTFELTFSHTDKDLVDEADSCRIFVTRGLFGFEFIRNWNI